MFQLMKEVGKVWIIVSWFKKYDTLSIFQDFNLMKIMIPKGSFLDTFLVLIIGFSSKYPGVYKQ